MTMHASFMAEHGARLADNGYAVIPIMPGAKVPGRCSGGEWTPRRFAAIAASSSVVSVNRNIRMLIERFAAASASSSGFGVSSGRTSSEWDMGFAVVGS